LTNDAYEGFARLLNQRRIGMINSTENADKLREPSCLTLYKMAMPEQGAQSTQNRISDNWVIDQPC